ncbi:glycosyltransferase [Achromobacter dolens]|jgi:hypothetical protein|uniref:glycosyltransferase family protein n=1 Tax=Achromobacter dolens TaxID=1287738 RepID=UPI0011AA5FEB|nr:glycosyltransferase [Achromobacter dolens]MCZ8411729.1 glycosyltransferase [Achromobacter dolens]CAB3880917.1 hypothetical protein LMG26842_04354 [Achromobacter dolens]
MRLFQNSGVYRAYFTRLHRLTRGLTSFNACRAAFLADRFNASHFLLPTLTGDESAFLTNGDDEQLQKMWAAEQGMSADADLGAILLAQIEHHRTEIFYNMDPMRYGSEFIRRLPGCVKHSIAWRAAPSAGGDFGAYDRIVCNFPAILQSYRDRGWKAAFFAPAHDPVMDRYASNTDRPIDILFVGGYSRHHRRRAEVLEKVAELSDRFQIRFHLDRSRLTKLAEAPWGHLLPLGKHRRPRAIRRMSEAPVFGLDLYQQLSRAKIVLNGAVDMAGEDRGNMRCFEAMGCGALMLSDAGRYPQGMQDGVNMLTYRDGDDAVRLAQDILAKPEALHRMAAAGHESVSTIYSKASQWRDFKNIVEAL